MKNIVILGGGTAGWLTALFFNKVFPEKNVTIVYNDKIGIVGVGEATTPPFINFMIWLGINMDEMFREVGATIKNGISFENWNGDNKKYFHPFKTKNDMDPWLLPPFFTSDCNDYYLKNLVKDKLDFNEYVYPTKLSYEDKVDLHNIHFAVHFDTNKMSKYLEKFGSKQNVKIIHNNYKGVKTDDNGLITDLILENQTLECDFVFDCSGFARLLIEKHFKESWKSYKDHLPMKSAIPFYLENDEEIHPYTQAIAMPHGWIWKIPLQHRIGAGYVFDSDYITADQAKKEAEDYLGVELDVTRCINFEAGRFENYWVKNCIAIGLSSSFIEPLESTSIHMTIVQLQILAHFVSALENYNEQSAAKYNSICRSHIDDILHFVYLHYITKRNDTDFWKNFKSDYPIPSNYKDMVNLIKSNNLHYFDTSNKLNDTQFKLHSYLCVCNGLEMFEEDIDITGYENIIPSIPEYKNLLDTKCKTAMTHREFIKLIQEGPSQ